MDFGDIWGNLVWIIPLFYVLKRMIFGPRKSETTKKPSTRELRQPESQRALSQKNREELREALGELGVALGFPESMMQEGEQPARVRRNSGLPVCSTSMPFDAERGTADETSVWIPAPPCSPWGRRRKKSLRTILWQERSLPETIYEADALFAEEEAFEARGNDQTREHKDESPETAAEELSPYERTKAPGEALRRLAARTPLQQAVVMKELLDRPVSLRWKSGLPFRT